MIRRGLILLLVVVCVLLSVLISCKRPDTTGTNDTQPVAPTQTAVEAQPQRRLVEVESAQFAQTGLDWVSVWIVRDQQTGAEFLITRTPNAVHALQIKTEPQR